MSKNRLADEAEDEYVRISLVHVKVANKYPSAKFAPTGKASDKYTPSPKVRPHDRIPQRTASVAERISQRLKDIQGKGVGKLAAREPENGEAAESEKLIPKVEKGKGKAIDPPPRHTDSPPPMSPPLPPAKVSMDVPISPMPPMPASPIIFAGLSLPPSAVSQLLTRAASELPLRPVRVPLLGEYPDCFTGEEFVTWLKENVHALGGSLDRAEDAARDLTENEGLLRRIGEIGNSFEHSEEAIYQFRPKV